MVDFTSQKNIGMTRFELATPATRTRCATKLRYIPINYKIVFFSEKRSLVYLLNGSREPEALLSPAPLSTCHRHLANGRPCYIPINYKIVLFINNYKTPKTEIKYFLPEIPVILHFIYCKHICYSGSLLLLAGNISIYKNRRYCT